MAGLLDWVINDANDGGVIGTLAMLQPKVRALAMDQLRMNEARETITQGKQAQTDLNSRYVEGTPWTTGETPNFTGETVFGRKTGFELPSNARAMLAYLPAAAVPGALEKVIPQAYRMQQGVEAVAGFNRAMGGGAPAAAPAPGPAPAIGSASGYVPATVRMESGGDPGAKNPLSSATGLGQFTDQTWLDVAPKITNTAGMSREQILALRSDGDLSKKAIDYYARSNAPTLANATGAPAVPDWQLGLAHRFGPGGATKLLSTDAATPIGQVLPDVIQQNPDLRNASVGDVLQRYQKAYGAGGAAPAPAAPQQQQASPLAALHPLTRQQIALGVQTMGMGDVNAGASIIQKAFDNDPSWQGAVAGAKATAETRAKPITLAPGAAVMPGWQIPPEPGAPVPQMGAAAPAGGAGPQQQAAGGNIQPGVAQLPGGGFVNNNSPALVNMSGPRSAYNTHTGETLAKWMGNVQQAAADAPAAIKQADELSSALQGMNTGPGAQTVAEAAAMLKRSTGMDLNNYLPTGMQLDPVQEQIAAKNINELAMVVAKANFPGGRITNADLDMAIRATPNLFNLPGANKSLIENIKQVQRLKIEQAKFFRDYGKRNNGELDYGVLDAWTSYLNNAKDIPDSVKGAYRSVSDAAQTSTPSPMAETPNGTTRIARDPAGKNVFEVGGKWQYGDGSPYVGK